VTPISKIARAKWTRGTAQAVERLLCKCEEALSSNPSPSKKACALENIKIYEKNKIEAPRAELSTGMQSEPPNVTLGMKYQRKLKS
jgi:hypothetical protein